MAYWADYVEINPLARGFNSFIAFVLILFDYICNMNNIQKIINDYVRCTKTYLIVDEKQSQFYLWRPFVLETETGPFVVLKNRTGNESIHFFLKLLHTENGVASDTSRSQYDKVYRFNTLLEKSKDSFTDYYLCRSLDELKIVGVKNEDNETIYSVAFPRERVLWSGSSVKRLKEYVSKNKNRLCLGKHLYEGDYFERERNRLNALSDKISTANIIEKPTATSRILERKILLDFNSMVITVAHGDKFEMVCLQPLPKAWLVYILTHNNTPLLYSQVLSDKEVLTKYYRLCSEASNQKRGQPHKEDSSIKPGLLVRKINAELARCCECVGLLPGSIAIARMDSLPKGAKQVDLPKMLIGASIDIVFPENC